MGNLLKGDTLVANNDRLVEKAESYDIASYSSNDIVPLSCWQAHKAELQGKVAGIWLDSDEAPLAIKDDLNNLPLIAINFPVFSDGRGYSYSKTLRDEYQYQGELRAIGDVLKDQVFFYKRCGFTELDLRSDRDADAAKQSLKDFTVTYQDGSDETSPVFHQR